MNGRPDCPTKAYRTIPKRPLSLSIACTVNTGNWKTGVASLRAKLVGRLVNNGAKLLSARTLSIVEKEMLRGVKP